MSDRLKYERFFWFHGQVKADRFPNANTLSETFELSRRTAQRDIEFIRDRLNAPLQYNHQRRGYCYTDDTYELPSQWISESNILALSLAVRLASTIPDQALKDQLCNLMDQVPIKTSGASASCLEQLSCKVSVKNIEYSKVNRDIFRKSVEALFAETSLDIIYHSPHTDTTSARTIQPLHLMHYMGSWHLIAWCGVRKDLRNFALSRIRTITPAIENLVLPVNLPDLKEYTREHFGIMQGGKSTLVALRFSQKITPWVSEQIWHPHQHTIQEEDGSLTLRFPVADLRELIKIVLSHGSDIQVLEPTELKQLVREEIDKMMKIYGRYDTA